jgi:hypothetical protein
MTSKQASNWVDRGESAVPEIERTLRFFFDRHDPVDAPRLQDAAEMLLGMVAAEASEVQIAGYLKHIAREFAITFPPHARLASVAVWHTAKAALIRDAAARRMTSEGTRPSPAPLPPLSVWLAERLLSPDELSQIQAETDGSPTRAGGAAPPHG